MPLFDKAGGFRQGKHLRILSLPDIPEWWVIRRPARGSRWESTLPHAVFLNCHMLYFGDPTL